MRRIGRVRSCKNSASCYNAQEEEGIAYVIEAVHAHAVAFVESYVAKPSDKSSDNGVCLTSGEGVGRIQGIHIDRFIPVMLIVIEGPGE